MKKENIRLKVIDKQENNLSAERETGLLHSPFNREIEIFKCIQSGDTEGLRVRMEEYFSGGVVMGNMSGNNTRQLQYWAVSTIAVAIHYAILGGMDETDAFNLSDEAIRHIDNLSDFDSIYAYLFNQAETLAMAVHASKSGADYPPAIRKVLHYIHIHLHERITVEDLSNHCKLSRAYLSSYFKKATGISVHEYVLDEKLKAAEQILSDGATVSEAAYRLSFCSEAHFIQAYKRKYNKTPGKREY